MATHRDDAERKFVEEGAKTTLQLALDIFGRAGRKLIELHELELATKSYLAAYLQRHGQVKVLLMPQPIPLRDIYTDAEVVSPGFLTRQLDLDAMQELYRKGHRTLFTGGPREDGMEIANHTQYLNVLGAPGAGKSTFLRRVGLEALLPRRTWLKTLRGETAETDSQYKYKLLPVLVELRQFRWADVNLPAILASEFEACGFPQSNTFVRRGLRNGRFLVLLDGLDEVPSEKLDAVLHEIRNLVSRYPKNRFITSCRTAYYKTFLQNFTDVVLADLSDSAIRQFVEQWFSSDEDRRLRTADHMWAELQSQPATLELARTPLLLTFICLTYDGTQRLPPNRSTLYRDALHILMERWAAEKRVHSGRILSELSADLEIEMLSDLAGPSFEADHLFFYRDEILTAFKSYLKQHANTPALSVKEILDAIEIQQGLLVCRGGDVYSFSHVTIQEYLTAHYFLDHERYRSLVARFTFDDRWHEVFLLVSGMFKGDDFVRGVRQQLNHRVLRNTFIHDTLLFTGSRLHAEVYTGSALERTLRLSALLALWAAIRVPVGVMLPTLEGERLISTMLDRLTFLMGGVSRRSYDPAVQTSADDRQATLTGFGRLRDLVASFQRDRYRNVDPASERAIHLAATRVRAVVEIWLELGLVRGVDEEAIAKLQRTQIGYTWDDFLEVVREIVKPTRLGLLSVADDQLRHLSDFVYGTLLVSEVANGAYRLSLEEWTRVERSMFRTS